MHCPHEHRLSLACGTSPMTEPTTIMPSGRQRSDLVYLLSDTAAARALARTMQESGIAAGVRVTRAGNALSVSRDDLVRIGSESLACEPLAMAG